MKVMLISSDNLYLTPYMSLYTELLNQHAVKYKILYWDKNENEPSPASNYIRFTTKFGSKIDKIRGYLLFIAVEV